MNQSGMIVARHVPRFSVQVRQNFRSPRIRTYTTFFATSRRPQRNNSASRLQNCNYVERAFSSAEDWSSTRILDELDPGPQGREEISEPAVKLISRKEKRPTSITIFFFKLKLYISFLVKYITHLGIASTNCAQSHWTFDRHF